MRRLLIALAAPALALACAEAPTTTATPDGARLARLDGAAQGGALRTAALSGANEVGTGGVLNAGDLDASGTARVTFNAGQRTICWDIAVTGTSPIILSHIHEAPAGVNGPVVVDFGITRAVPVTDGTFSGCTTVTRELVKEIAKDPANYYVNVHSSEFPSGAVRGQLD